jgi:hypothetical protein
MSPTIPFIVRPKAKENDMLKLITIGILLITVPVAIIVAIGRVIREAGLIAFS